MKRIAIIVQRWFPEVAGGSEQEAGQYARYLRDAGFAVDIVTTTARDATTWAEEFEAGTQALDGDEHLRVVRFAIASGRTPVAQGIPLLYSFKVLLFARV